MEVLIIFPIVFILFGGMMAVLQAVKYKKRASGCCSAENTIQVTATEKVGVHGCSSCSCR